MTSFFPCLWPIVDKVVSTN